MKFHRYESRFKAGEILAEFIKEEAKVLNHLINQDPNYFFCFAIPNGGISVTEGYCSQFNIKYDILIVRKIKIPFNTEAGFGSVTTDGTILINEPLLNQLGLSESAVQDSINLTKQEIQDRLEFYNKEINLEDVYKKNIQNKYIFLLDDGLASGFTMLAAIKMIKKYNPTKIFIAVPTAPLRTVKRVIKEVDEIFCPNIRDVMWFAVADAYKNWYDVPEMEVIEILNNSQYYISNI
ncbi:MAG: phosphoribosyltransferase [Candidatus Hodarchaeota archaeon]